MRGLKRDVRRARELAPGKARRERIRIFEIRRNERDALPPTCVAQRVRRRPCQGPGPARPVAGDLAGGGDPPQPVRGLKGDGAEARPLRGGRIMDQQGRVLNIKVVMCRHVTQSTAQPPLECRPGSKWPPVFRDRGARI